MATGSGDWLLEIRDETGEARRVSLSQDAYVVGRSEQSDIQLDRPTVSRRHAQLRRGGDGQWRVHDLGSRAGTLLNNQRIELAELKAGDVLSISRFALRLIDPSQAPVEPSSASQRVPSVDKDAPDISVLTRIAPPRLDTSHIAALHEFGKRLIGMDSPEERLRALCEVMTGEVIRAKWVLALRIDGDDPSHPLEQLAAHPPDVLEREDLHVSRSTIRAMQESKAPVLASNFKGDKGVVEMSIIAKAPATAVVACPLNEDEGADKLIYVNLPPMYGSGEWLALIALAVKQYQQAEAASAAREAIRIQTAVERDLANARRIQMSLLPNREAIQAIDVAWSFDPCESVGGDFVDVVPMSDGRYLLAIADVTGHGLPAALTTLSVHSIVHTCLRGGSSPVEMMQILNEHLCDYMPDGRFVTMACVAVDPATGELECINAGHNAPIIFDAAGLPRALQEGKHLPLGIDRFEFESQRDRIEPGHTLFLVTDGITELPVRDGELLGADGINAMITSLLSGNMPALGGMIEAIGEQLQQMTSEPKALDDQTYLLMRR